jgi:hypothetical protein
MNIAAVEKIANAVLYEGYLLYPYRASAVKNQQRFNFGVLYPPSYCDSTGGSEACQMQTECLLKGERGTTIEVKVRFLQMIARDGRQEGIERDVSTPLCSVESVRRVAMRQAFAFGDLRGELELSASRVDDQVSKLCLRIRNLSKTEATESRDSALLLALVSAHSILRVERGGFLSAIDPPNAYRAAADECRNVGTWPVLAGREYQTDLMLSSPIILYDYPQIAPESPGDLCDGTEIDEILALRILTMTEAEKLEVRNGDDRARLILERTEMLPREHFEKLHGALRGLQIPEAGQ